jgi:hypothetical protein
MTLNEIAHKHGADKASDLVGRETHGYADFYEQLVSKYPADLKLLEIGLWDPQLPGASPRMWREFLPKSVLFGMDIAPDSKSLEAECNMKVAILDQSNVAQLNAAMAEFGNMDIIIDDGSHINHHFVTSLYTLWPYLSPGGTYCIEDLHAPYAQPKEILLNVAAELEGAVDARFVSPKLFVVSKRA